MKILSQRIHVVWLIVLLSIVSSLCLLHFFPLVKKVYLIYWLFTLSSIIFLITPAGKRPLPGIRNTDKQSHLQWVGKIVAAELGLLLAYFGIHAVTQNIFILPELSSPTTVLSPTSMDLLYLGLFPWTAIAIIAIGIAFYHEPAHLTAPLLRITKRDLIGIIISVSANVAILFILSILFCFCVLLCSSFLNQHNIQNTLIGFRYFSSFIVFLFLLLTASQRMRQRLHRLITQSRIKVIMVIMASIGISAVIIAVLASVLKPIQPTLHAPPYLIKKLLQLGMPTLQESFSLGFWFASIALMSIYIASLSAGYKIRSVLCVTLFCPLLFTIILFYFPHFTLPLFLLKPIAFIALLLLFYLFLNERQIGYFINNNVHATPKFRTRDPFVHKILMTSTAFLYLYLLTNIAGLAVLGFLFTLPYQIAILLMSIAIPYRLLRHS